MARIRLRQTLIRSLDILLIPITVLIIGNAIGKFFNLDILLIIITAVYILKNIFLDGPRSLIAGPNLLDVSVFLLFGFEITSYLTSTYKPNSFYFLFELMSSILFYCLVRLNLRHAYQQVSIFILISLLGFILSCGAILTFYVQYRQLSLYFSDLTGLRHLFSLFNPTDAPSGEWATTFLLLLPFPLILFLKFDSLGRDRWLLLCPVITILVVIAITFSRGLYLATTAFALLTSTLFYLYRCFNLKRIVFFNALTFGLLVVSLTPVIKPVLTTVLLFRTTSQVRSFAGRENLWKHSLGMIKEHPLLGSGSNNFPMQYVAHRGHEDDSVYAARGFNYFLQIVLEKGFIGLVVYCLLLVAFFRVSHERIRQLQDNLFLKNVTILFVTTYAALLVRDLSYSSILSNAGVQCLLWFMFANNTILKEESAG